MDWDQPLKEPQAEKWHGLVAELKQARPISIPRGYFNNVNGQVESCHLYGFCDASKKAWPDSCQLRTMDALSSLLKLDPPRYYSDSQVALYRICGHGKQTVYAESGE